MAEPESLWKAKTVKFDVNIVETSFGGTQRTCPIRGSSGSSLSFTDSSKDSLNDMDKAFLSESPQSPKEPMAKRRVRSFPCDVLNTMQSAEHPYKIMRAALKNSLLKEEDSAGVTVAVRVRPFTKRELEADDVNCVISMQGDETIVRMDSGQNLTFTYDYSLWSFCDSSPNFADQQLTYEAVAKPLLGKALKGYNACLFAYGMTSSGKSHCIMGTDDDPGIIPRFSEELFDSIERMRADDIRMNVEISFFEIYNEKIHDLLTTSADGKLTKRLNLKVREHPVTGPYVEGLSIHVINCFEDLKMWLSLGNKQRATASTGMNEKSSRSHSVFTINLTQTKTEDIEGELHEHSITSKINLIDLAGSERQSTAKTSGDRLKEGASINKSLLTLGKVISQLCELGESADNKKRKVFIPYRDSVLTWLLKESLGGNSQTAMLATISPANICMDETISTLRYASQARYIVNKARINEDPKARLIRELRAEIDKLRAMMTGSLTDDEHRASGLAEIASLKAKLIDKEERMMLMTRSWEERLKASELKMREETKYLEKSGIALKINQNLPYLVNLNEDPLLSETLVYVLHEGMTRVGQASEDSSLDIQLSGALIAPEHCVLHYDNESVKVEPVLDALTYVNGNQVFELTSLQHGDRVILGGDHYFRYHHAHAQSARTRSASGNSIKDFQFAKDELIQVQNARMEKELAEVRRATKLEMEKQKIALEKEAKQKLDQCLAETKREADEILTQQKQSYEEKLKVLSEKLDEKDFDTKLAEEVKRQASHLLKENEHLQHEVEIYKKQVIGGPSLSPVSEDNILAEIEAIKSQISEECKHWSELRQSARKSALTPARSARRKTPRRLLNGAEDVQASPGLAGVPNSPGLNSVQNQDSDHRNEIENDEAISYQGSVYPLYEVALMIREANKISESLSKGTEFHRELIDDSTVCVRVSKPSMGISTFWSVDKLSSRLHQMREMYEDAADPEDSDPFYDTSDTWEQDDRISSPALIHKRLKAIRRSLSPKVTLSRKLSFNDEQVSPLVLGEAQSPQTDQSPGKPTLDFCQDLLKTVFENFSADTQDSLVDMILLDLQTIHDHLSAVVLDGLDSVSLAEIALKLVSGFQSLCIHFRCWTHDKSVLGEPIVRMYEEKLSELIRKLYNELALLVQGCQSRISAMIEKSSKEAQKMIYQITKVAGEFSLASQSHVTVCFFNDENRKLNSAIMTAFLSGSDLFVDKTLKGAITNVEESEFRIQTLRDCPSLNSDFDKVYEQTELLIASVRVLLSTVQETQVTMETLSVKCDVEPAYYGNNYKRLTGLVFEVSSISEQVRRLMQTANSVANGKEHEIERVQKCAETIDKITGRIVVKCTGSVMESDDLEAMMEMSGDDRVHTAAQEIRLSVQELAQSVKRLVRTHPHLALSSPRASPAKVWGPEKTARASPAKIWGAENRADSPRRVCRNIMNEKFENF